MRLESSRPRRRTSLGRLALEGRSATPTLVESSLKLLKLAALVRISARRITVALASACRYANEWSLAAACLA